MYNTIPPKIASLQHRKDRIVVDPIGKRVGDKIKGGFRQTLILKCQKGIYARSKTRAPLANKFCTTSRCNTATLQKKSHLLFANIAAAIKIIHQTMIFLEYQVAGRKSMNNIASETLRGRIIN